LGALNPSRDALDCKGDRSPSIEYNNKEAGGLCDINKDGELDEFKGALSLTIDKYKELDRSCSINNSPLEATECKDSNNSLPTLMSFFDDDTSYRTRQFKNILDKLKEDNNDNNNINNNNNNNNYHMNSLYSHMSTDTKRNSLLMALAA